MKIVYNVVAMALYLLIFSCLATISVAVWLIFFPDDVGPYTYRRARENLTESHTMVKDFVL